MRHLRFVLTVMATAAAAVLLVQVVQRRLSDATFAIAVNPQVLAHLQASLDDQRELARLDPARRETYRDRFESLETTVHRLQILAHNREEMVRRYDNILLGVVGASVLLVAAVSLVRQSRQQPRLGRLQRALTDLAQGRTDIQLGERRRDTIGRIAAMVERTSRVMAGDRKRLAALQNLSAWQEAARRHAHEMRTPLTAARLEIVRLQDLLGDEQLTQGDELAGAARGALEELDRLASFARRFTSFARLPEPRLERQDASALLDEFVRTYRGAWSNLDLEVEAPGPVWIRADRDMLRQVLVNLCDNSSHALGHQQGAVRFAVAEGDTAVSLEVADDGPGIDPQVTESLFEPYVTTRTVGEAMGLGLAICRKILLDHGGDLELARAEGPGAVFRLTLPRGEEEKS